MTGFVRMVQPSFAEHTPPAVKAVFLDFATMGDDDLNLSGLTSALPGIEFYATSSREEVARRIEGAEFIIANKSRLDAAVLSQAKSLRYVGLAATGSDNVDLDFARDAGIAVTNIRGYCTQSVVEHVFGVMFMLTHSLHRHHQAVASGRWQASDTFALIDYPIRELSSMTLGVVGFGELGSNVARTAEQFGMQVVVARRIGTQARAGDGRVPIEQLLKVADVVSLHCPLNDATRGMMSADAFRLMRNDAILINTARGALVESAALVAALKSGEIAGAAIDVLAEEPPVNGDPLLDYRGDNLVLTPHIAWATRKARQRAVDELSRNIVAFQEGRERCRLD